MKKSEKKELLNNWPNMSAEERSTKLAELQESLSERKYKKLLVSLEKIQNSLQEESYSSNEVEENNYVEENNQDYNSQENYENVTEETIEDTTEVPYEESYDAIDENVETFTSDDSEIDLSIDLNDESNDAENLNENWVIENDEINIDDSNFENELSSIDESFDEINDDMSNNLNEVPASFDNFKKQIGSDERAWNRNAGIIYSQEELIYKLSNSQNISDEEYKMLLISAQKKIEFIQLLIEKSRVKNAAYSYDFLNSMCWRVDKALKTFLAANKR